MNMEKTLLIVSVAGILGAGLPAVSHGAGGWHGGGNGQAAVSESLS